MGTSGCGAYDFFNAPVVNLYHIARMIGAQAQ